MPSDDKKTTCPCCLGISYYSSALARLGKEPICLGIRSQLDTTAIPLDDARDERPGKSGGFYLTCMGFSYRRSGDALPECEGIELLSISTSSSIESKEVKGQGPASGSDSQATATDPLSSVSSSLLRCLKRGRNNLDLIRGLVTIDFTLSQDSPASFESMKSLGSRFLARGGQNVERVKEVISQVLGSKR
jgi:hypothetical protein